MKHIIIYTTEISAHSYLIIMTFAFTTRIFISVVSFELANANNEHLSVYYCIAQLTDLYYYCWKTMIPFHSPTSKTIRSTLMHMMTQVSHRVDNYAKNRSECQSLAARQHNKPDGTNMC
jgi:hypothetical protein